MGRGETTEGAHQKHLEFPRRPDGHSLSPSSRLLTLPQRAPRPQRAYATAGSCHGGPVLPSLALQGHEKGVRSTHAPASEGP